MSSYFITGKLGSGKTLVAVGRIFDYLGQGRLVATNLDLHLANYLNAQSKKSYIRIPDKPTVSDMEFIGLGNLSCDESKNGLLVLDELGSWFNARSWQDKSRKELLDWFIHARKYGWDVLLIVQDISMVDAQLRGMLGEHLVICKRLDRLKIPFVGSILKALGLPAMLPKIHSARVHYGETPADLVVDRWMYRGTSFYSAYDTRQVFSPYYSDGVFCALSPWHRVGRYFQFFSLREKFHLFFDRYLMPQVRPVVLKKKLILVERIQRLPPGRRVEFFRRFDSCGAFK